jgi:hypothetical protein
LENINDLIYAYSLGCLEDEELQRLNLHQDNNEELDIKELGEFQNLVSLLPSTLTLEIPDPQLKDNVAKKLYRLKDEIKAQRQKNKPTLNNQDNKEEKEPEHSLKEPEEVNSENNTFNANQIEDNEIQNLIEESIDLSSNNKIPLANTTFPVKKNNNFMIWGIALFILLAIGSMVTYWNISLKTNNLNNEVEKLKKEIGSLNIQLIGNQEIQEMLQSPDVQVINLKGTNTNPNSFGKIIIGADRGAGYVQIAQMPAIPGNKIFELWVSISGSYVSLKTFQPSDTMGFYSFKILKLPKEEDINFLITEEPFKGSTTPGNKVYLRGIFNP